jgi:hypothetical protein
VHDQTDALEQPHLEDDLGYRSNTEVSYTRRYMVLSVGGDLLLACRGNGLRMRRGWCIALRGAGYAPLPVSGGG